MAPGRNFKPSSNSPSLDRGVQRKPENTKTHKKPTPPSPPRRRGPSQNKNAARARLYLVDWTPAFAGETERGTLINKENSFSAINIWIVGKYVT